MKKSVLFGLIAVLMLSAAGCGSSGTTTASKMEMAADTAAGAMTPGIYNKEVMPEEAGETKNEAPKATERKLIKTVHMTTETEDYDALVQELYDKVETFGGYVENFSTQGAKNYRYGSITARVPKERLDEFLTIVEDSSNITYREESVEDVTLTYVDLESHKKMLLKEQERLMEFLEEAETIEDIIAIEGRLTEVQYQLESMESQLRTYDNQIDYSTVYLNIEEVVRYTPQEQKGTWAQIKTGFAQNLYDVGNGIRNFFVGLIISLPKLVVLAGVIGILALIAKGLVRRKKKRSERKQADRTGTQTVQNTGNTEAENRWKGTEKDEGKL